MFDNNVVRNKHDIMISVKMQNSRFFQFFDKIVFIFEQFDDDEFENDENEHKICNKNHSMLINQIDQMI